MDSPPTYLRPTAPGAERAIVVGDPGRALLLAQELIESPPPMFNHHRGFWGYSGTALVDGRPLVVQGTGLGATSINAVTEDLIDLGVERIIRVGTCTAAEGLSVGDLLVVTEAIGLDGVSRHLSGTDPMRPDAQLTESVSSGLRPASTEGKVTSLDLGHGPEFAAPGSAATDLATAALFATATARGIRAAAVLVAVRDADSELDDAELEQRVRTAGRAAAASLTLG